MRHLSLLVLALAGAHGCSSGCHNDVSQVLRSLLVRTKQLSLAGAAAQRLAPYPGFPLFELEQPCHRSPGMHTLLMAEPGSTFRGLLNHGSWLSPQQDRRVFKSEELVSGVHVGYVVQSRSNSSLERSGHDKVLTSRPCAARAQLVRYIPVLLPRTFGVHSAVDMGAPWFALLPRRSEWVVVRSRPLAANVNLVSQGMPPRIARKAHQWVVDKVPSVWGAPRFNVGEVQAIYSGGRASCSRGALPPVMPERLRGVAPLRQWSHDRAMHLGSVPLIWRIALRGRLSATGVWLRRCVAVR